MNLLRKQWLKLLLATAAAALLGAPAARAQPAAIVVDTAYVVAAAARGAIIWDVRGENEYLRGHIPGAINIDDIGNVLRDPQSEDYIAIEDIERLLGEAGIDPAREIVLYSTKANPAPYFGYITLRWLGADNARVYHGGIDDWKSAGQPMATDFVKLPPVAFKAQPDPQLLISTREVVEKLGDPAVQIVDARSTREYRGEDIRALRGGRIPGAVNIPYEANWVDPDTPRKLARRAVTDKDGMNLKPRDDLAKLYAGLDPDKETIVYCQSGWRASETATVLKELGFSRVRVYDSSWLGYGNSFSAPVENATYFNVTRVNRMIDTLQSQIDQLQGEIAQLKAAQQKTP
jgi:thiosulfate/3-mercaptopyruvate sulfurtransferase